MTSHLLCHFLPFHCLYYFKGQFQVYVLFLYIPKLTGCQQSISRRFLLKCISLRSGQFSGQKSPDPLKMSLEMSHKVICPQKIILRIFKISGTLIVIIFFCLFFKSTSMVFFMEASLRN
jgi:hypothetical protein